MEKKVLNYRIIIEKEKYEDGYNVYVAYCPSLGISDYGDTVEDVLASIKDGVKLAVHPKPIPQGTLRAILRQIDITAELNYSKKRF